jgi:hypothetical protein
MSIERWSFGLVVAAALTFAAGQPATTADTVSGSLEVAGKKVTITHGFAQAKKGFFDETMNDIQVVLCDAVVPVGSTREEFARRELADAGKVHCVENTINAKNQVINFSLRHNAFKMSPSGGSTSAIFEPKVVTATRIEGRIRTTETMKSFEDIPYSYDVQFSLTVAARKE